MPNIPAFAFAYHGIQKIGAIVVSINPALKTDEVTFILNDSEAAILITTNALRVYVSEKDTPHLKRILIDEYEDKDEHRVDDSLANLMAATPPETRTQTMQRDDPAAIVYTSGTTGFPKGATLSHGNVISNILTKKRCLNIRPADRLLLFVPLFHCFGQNAVLNTGLIAGATVVLHLKFDPEKISRSILKDGVTMFFGVPTSYVVLLERLSPEQAKSLRYCFSAAAPLHIECWATGNAPSKTKKRSRTAGSIPATSAKWIPKGIFFSLIASRT